MTWIVLFIFPLAAAAKAPGSLASQEFSEKDLLIELTGKDPGRLSELELYSEIVSAYQSQDEIGLRSRLETLLSRFPKSALADNALFLAGRQAVELKKFGPAIQFFERVINEYPRGNRVVAAQFAKAMTYRRMNLREPSDRLLKEVRAKYPGSPESFRAENEMRIFN